MCLLKKGWWPLLMRGSTSSGGGFPPLSVDCSYANYFICFLSSRLHQVVKLYMYSPSSGLYSCPLAMTDGAASLIEVSGHDRWSC